MWQNIKSWWNSWKQSGTIVWSRLQVIVGAIFLAASSTDLSTIIPAKWLPFWLIASGAITEIIRHQNSPEIRQ